VVLKGVATNIRALITDADGEPVAAETKVKVTAVRDSDGHEYTGEVKTDKEGTATYELAAQPAVDLLTFTREGTGFTFTTYEEVVGARLCSLAQIREGISEVSEEEVTEEQLAEARDIAEQVIEDECGVAFRPRYAREVLDGNGAKKLLLSHPKISALLSVELEEEALEVADLKAYPSGGSVWREEGWTEGVQNVEVVYEHGFPYPPAQATRVCALLARHIASKRPSNLDDRATSISTEDAAYSLITPGVRGMVTAIPEVNAFISSWQFPQVG
jgi:hypothetical protein